MKAKKKRILIIVSALLLVALLAGVGIFVYKKSNEPVSVIDCNMYEAAALAEGADYLHLQEEKDILAQKLKVMQKRLDVASLDIHDLRCYLDACYRLSLDVDIAGAKASLAKHYISDISLFTHGFDENDGKNDEMDMKANRDLTGALTLTMLIIRAYPPVLEWEEFALRRGIADAIANMEYVLPKTDGSGTLYGAGGMAMSAIYSLRKIDGIDYAPFLPEGTDEWYQAWKNYYAEQPFFALSFASFYPIAMVMEGECSVAELQAAYASMPGTVSTGNDIVMLLQTLYLVDAEQNPACLETFRSCVLSMIENYQFLRER